MKPKRLLAALIFISLFALGAIQLASFIHFAASPAVSPSQAAGEAPPSAIIEIAKGMGPVQISKRLAESGVVANASRFQWLGRLTREWKNIKAGEYEVSAAQTPLQIFKTITSGVSISHSITVREGQNMYEIATALEQRKLATRNAVLELCRSPEFLRDLGFKDPLPPSLEGYLFPDTYFFNRAMSAKDMLRQMVRHFNSIWNERYSERARQLALSRHQIVTLASIIEKETGAPHERPLISSVFHNRLKKRMRLQSDPTTIYGMWERYSGNISKKDLLEVNEYNTYAIPALPVGPIGNPGRESLEAALYPAESDFYFFVSQNDGTHQFTRTFGDHQNAVRKYQLDANARKGKSWRDLSKKLGTASGSAQ